LGGEPAFGFAGEVQGSAGVLHLRARQLDPKIGRFLQRDTFSGDSAQPQSLNRYAYGGNNPHSFVDPSGNSFEPVSSTLANVLAIAPALKMYFAGVQANARDEEENAPRVARLISYYATRESPIVITNGNRTYKLIGDGTGKEITSQFFAPSVPRFLRPNDSVMTRRKGRIIYTETEGDRSSGLSTNKFMIGGESVLLYRPTTRPVRTSSAPTGGRDGGPRLRWGVRG